MLSKVAVGPLVLRRSASVAATAQRSSPASIDTQVKVTRAPSGLVLVSCDLGGPISRLSLGFKAGVRYESPSNLGVAHRLRNCLGGGSSKDHTQVNLLWRTSMIGANITTSLSRENITANMQVAREHSERGLKLLCEIGASPSCNVWELEETMAMMKMDVHESSEQLDIGAFDALHKAAYRNGGLGNSLLARPGIYFTDEQVLSYANTHLLSGEGCLAGVNIDHQTLLDIATDLPISQGQGVPPPSSPYLGGDHRVNTGGSVTHWILANKGADIKSPDQQAVQLVLAHALGAGPQIKWANGMGMGDVAQSISKRLGSEAYGYSSISVGHSDSGLFGIYLITKPDSIGKAAEGAVEGIRAVAASISEDRLIRAKQLAAMQVGLRAEDGGALSEEMVGQSLVSNAVTTPGDVIKLIHSVTANQVQQAAKQFLSGKVSIACVGLTCDAPYKEDLGL